MDGRPVAATIVPLLALALVVVGGGVVVAAQAKTGRPELVRRAKEWGEAVAHGDLPGAERFLSPRDQPDRAMKRRLDEILREYSGGEMRLMGVEKHPKSVWTTYQVLVTVPTRFSSQAVAAKGFGVDWVRGDDGTWYVELGEP